MTETMAEHAPPTRVVLGGDLMLGRLVGQAIGTHGIDYPLGPVADFMRGADVTIVNLECAITAATAIWPGAPKAFYFGAPPAAVQCLVHAGIDLVSLANNHALDFGVPGLLETLKLLRAKHILAAGAGQDRASAHAPAVIVRRGLRFGMAACCDHQEDFAAGVDMPGIAYLDLRDEEKTQEALRAAWQALRRARVDWPILSLHWGPNMVRRPCARFRRLAHAAVDMGWKIVFGHSAHVFQGVEMYRGCPILYAAGDLVDDYYVDPEFMNDHQFLFELEIDGGALRRLLLHPLLIADCQVRFAHGRHAESCRALMRDLCAELGTCLHDESPAPWIGADGK